MGAPIVKALALANLTGDEVHKVEVVGGAWRIPKVGDQILQESGKSQLQKTMNADEAFCFGAALYAASLSTAFRLRKFGVHDITSFPVSIDIDSLGGGAVEEDAEEGEEGKEAAEGDAAAKKNVKLFKVGHKIPAKRLLTFKRDEDLTFTVKYDGELPPTVPVTIAKYNITGVKKAMDKYPNGTKPKINVSFRLTRSGLVEVDKAEAAIEEMVEVEVCETIKPKKKNVTDANATEANATDSEAADKEEAPAAAEKAEEAPAEGDEKKDDAEAKDADAEKKEGDEAEKKEGDDKKAAKEEPTRVCKMKEEKRVHRVALQIESETPLPKPITAAQFKEIKKELDEYDAREKKIRDRAAAYNALESYIYTTREKLESKQELIEVCICTRVCVCVCVCVCVFVCLYVHIYKGDMYIFMYIYVCRTHPHTLSVPNGHSLALSLSPALPLSCTPSSLLSLCVRACMCACAHAFLWACFAICCR